MRLSARQARLHLAVGGTDFAVLGLSGKEELNQLFTFHVNVLTDGWSTVGHHLGRPACLTMTASDGYERRVNGILTEIQSESYLPDGQCIIRLTVESCLVLLRHRTDSRLIVSETLPDIIRQTLQRHDIPAGRLDFQLSRQYPVRHTTLQAQEDDLSFVRRLAGRQGMLLWSEEIDGDEIIHLADTTNRCPMLAREFLTYTPDAGMETTDGPVKVGMLGIADRAFRVPAQHWVHDVHENAPEHPTLVGRSTDGQRTSGRTETHSVTFGSGAANEEEAKHQALIRAQRAATIRHHVEIRTHAADLRVGALIRLDTTGYSSTLSGDYLITAVTHQARQYAGFGLGGEADCPYTNTAILIPREAPWRPELPKVPELPQIFSARVESRDPVPELDATGRYRYRQYPDSNNAPHAEASAPTRRLQPYASPSDGMPFGWHLPLHGDNEVLISCLNRDPDQPMLVGTLSNPAHGSVVTKENAHQNLLHTFGGNQLAMDDWRDKSSITLCTFAGHTMLHFNADVAGHRINLASGLGQMEYYAKKTIATTSGDTLTETVGNDRIQQIENRQCTTTKQKEIHYQAKTDGEITAADIIRMESGKNIELTAGQDLRLDITESTRIHVHEQDAIIHIDSGSLIIEADGAITIEGDGQGTILFEQNGGGFSMAPNGDITIFGDEITLEADEINFYGQVTKEITEPPAAPVATALAPLTAATIDDLYEEVGEQDEPSVPPAENIWDDSIEVRLVDEMDHPIPGQSFTVTGNDSQTYSGTTDTNGIGRIDSLSPGLCRISWPGLDRRRWTPLGGIQTIDAADNQSADSIYTVQKDDSLAAIAQRYSLRARDLWDHPNNKSLKAKRQNPNILFVGDELFIPGMREKSATGKTGKRHEFILRGNLTTLRIQLLADGHVRANEAYSLELGNGRTIKGETDGRGHLHATIPADTRQVLLRLKSDLGTEQYTIEVGRLDPSDEILGIQQRLANLGFAIQETGQLDDQTKSALMAFQSASGLEATGDPDGVTKQNLIKLHGS
jgi:type VI secretion system secreted protein VgrG